MPESLILIEHDPEWSLCGTSEGMMRESIEDGALVVVNEALVVKFVGMLTALCIRTLQVGNVTFQEGKWYSPKDETTRRTIKHAFRDGQAKISIQGCTWSYMRDVQDYELEDDTGAVIETVDRSAVLQEVRTAVATLPDTLPDTIAGMSRDAYLFSADQQD